MSDETTTAAAENPAGLAFNVNRDWLRLMDKVRGGHITRSHESGRDLLRRQNAGGWNDHLGGRMRRLEEAGLAVLLPTYRWELTPLGERRRAEAEAGYAASRIAPASP